VKIIRARRPNLTLMFFISYEEHQCQIRPYNFYLLCKVNYNIFTKVNFGWIMNIFYKINALSESTSSVFSCAFLSPSAKSSSTTSFLISFFLSASLFRSISETTCLTSSTTWSLSSPFLTTSQFTVSLV